MYFHWSSIFSTFKELSSASIVITKFSVDLPLTEPNGEKVIIFQIILIDSLCGS